MNADIISLSARLESTPRPYAKLTGPEKDTLSVVLKTKGPWRDEQYQWIRQWFLVASPAKIKAWNEALTKSIRVGGTVTKRRQTVLSADLLSDCGPGQTYEAIGEELKACKLVKLAAKDFPEPEQDA